MKSMKLIAFAAVVMIALMALTPLTVAEDNDSGECPGTSIKVKTKIKITYDDGSTEEIEGDTISDVCLPC